MEFWEFESEENFAFYGSKDAYKVWEMKDGIGVLKNDEISI